MFNFGRRKKQADRRSPAKTAPAIRPLARGKRTAEVHCPSTARPARSSQPPPASKDAETCKAGPLDIDALAEKLATIVVPHLERQDSEFVAQLTEYFTERRADDHAAIEQRIDGLAGKIGEGLTEQFEQQGGNLQDSLKRRLTPLANHVAVATRKDAAEHCSALRGELREVCSANTQRAAQRPIIDGLLALLDRIGDEGVYLNAWYRKDPEMAIHAGCGELQGRYDDAVRSLAIEIHIILRGLGVELIQECAGPFNPKHQRVVDVELTSNPKLDGYVARIVRAGFMWDGTILRPEQVVVFKKECKNHGKQS